MMMRKLKDIRNMINERLPEDLRFVNAPGVFLRMHIRVDEALQYIRVHYSSGGVPWVDPNCQTHHTLETPLIFLKDEGDLKLVKKFVDNLRLDILRLLKADIVADKVFETGNVAIDEALNGAGQDNSEYEQIQCPVISTLP
jgi:hypothetical protein